MQVVIHATAARAAESVAQFVADCLSEEPDLVLGLPTGRTPVPMYAELVRLHRAGRADFSRAASFNLDEFVGLGASHPGSYAAFMRRHLFAHVNFAPGRTHIPRGAAADPSREAARFERRLQQAGGLDVVILGVGANGHIGFNEPAAALNARTSIVRLREASRRANADAFGGKWQRVPARAISMGIATILSARHVVLLATGAGKARIVRKALEGPITTRVPASLLRAHPRVVAVLDRAAASALTSAAPV